MSESLKKMDKIMYDMNIDNDKKVQSLQFFINNLDNYYNIVIANSNLEENEKLKYINQVSRVYPQLRYILNKL